MQKRAGLARAMALDPEILFFDEPSAGLDPISSRLLDDLILELRDSLGATIVVVTHELASIFAIGTNSVFLDVETRTMTARGPPKELLHSGKRQRAPLPEPRGGERRRREDHMGKKGQSGDHRRVRGRRGRPGGGSACWSSAPASCSSTPPSTSASSRARWTASTSARR